MDKCPICNGQYFIKTEKEGYTFYKPCECYYKMTNKRSIMNSNIPVMYENADFNLDDNVKTIVYKSTYDKNTLEIDFEKVTNIDINKFAKEYCDKEINKLKDNSKDLVNSLYFSGVGGTEEVYIACAIARKFLYNSLNVYYMRLNEYIDLSMKSINDKDLIEKKEYILGETDKKLHLLIIDDFVLNEQDSVYKQGEIINLIKSRIEKNLATIIVSKILPKDLVKINSELVASLLSNYLFFTIITKTDNRIKRNNEILNSYDWSKLK